MNHLLYRELIAFRKVTGKLVRQPVLSFYFFLERAANRFSFFWFLQTVWQMFLEENNSQHIIIFHTIIMQKMLDNFRTIKIYPENINKLPYKLCINTIKKNR